MTAVPRHDPYQQAGEPCMCNRLNGTLGYVTPADCPMCHGSGVVSAASGDLVARETTPSSPPSEQNEVKG